MAYENNDRRTESAYSKRLKAGKRRTYFFDVKATRGNDFFLTITESRKKFNEDGYERHKIFLYKEDFNKFLKALTEAVDYVKTDLMPDFDFDAFNHEYPETSMNGKGTEDGKGTEENMQIENIETIETKVETPAETPAPSVSDDTPEADKW